VELGGIYVTHDAAARLRSAGMVPEDLLGRHVTGDWGDVELADASRNTRALIYGGQLFSSYELPSGEAIWVTTEGAPGCRLTTVMTVFDWLVGPCRRHEQRERYRRRLQTGEWQRPARRGRKRG
jgi:hypothetical protein